MEWLHREVVRVLDSHLSRLSDAVKHCLPAFAERMFEKGFISETVKDNPENFNKVASEFKANFLFVERIEDIESKFGAFLDIFRDLGGPLKGAADKMEEEIKKAINHQQHTRGSAFPIKKGHSFLSDNEVLRLADGTERVNSPLFLIPHIFRSSTHPHSYDHRPHEVVTTSNNEGLEQEELSGHNDSGYYDAKEVAQPEDKVKPNNHITPLATKPSTESSRDRSYSDVAAHNQGVGGSKGVGSVPPRDSHSMSYNHQAAEIQVKPTQEELCVPQLNNSNSIMERISPSQEETNKAESRHPLSIGTSPPTRHKKAKLSSGKKAQSQEEISKATMPGGQEHPSYKTLDSCPGCVELHSLKWKQQEDQKAELEGLRDKVAQFEQQREEERLKEKEEFQKQMKRKEESLSKWKSDLKKREKKIENDDRQLLKKLYAFNQEMQLANSQQESRELMITMRMKECAKFEGRLEKWEKTLFEKKARLKQFDEQLKERGSKLTGKELRVTEQEKKVTKDSKFYWQKNGELQERERILKIKERKYLLIRSISIVLFLIVIGLFFLFSFLL